MKGNMTPRNTERISDNRNNNYEYPKKKHVKYGDDDLIIPVSNDADSSVYDAIITPNGMNGREHFFSVPKNADDTAHALHQYLEKLKGKNVCAALWTNGKNKIEKCGTLIDVGNDYITIRSNKTKRLFIIGMEKVKYISVFCV